MYDILIKNGQIVDGSGQPAFYGDLAIRGGKIAKIAPAIDEPAAEILDAAGLQVTPGLIDTHSHSDSSVYTGSDCYNYLEQGVTTQIAGQCGSSLAPYYEGLKNKHGLSPEERALWMEKGKDPRTFMDTAEKASFGTNMAYFIGHSAIRGHVLGFSDQAPTEEELRRMKAYVQQAMEAGFLGMSSGLVYIPSVYAKTEELVELAKVMKPYGGIYVTHVRGEGNNVLTAVREAIQIGRESNVSVFISHLKVMGKRNEGTSAELLREIDQANAEGIPTWADQYPYTASAAPLASQIPPKYQVGGLPALLERLRDPSIRQQILYSIFNEPEEFESGILHAGFEGAMVGSAKNTPEYVGKTIAQIAEEEGKEPIDALSDFLIANEAVAGGYYFNQCVPDLFRIMAHPRVFCGSDMEDYPDARFDHEQPGNGHPRGYASMVRRLELVRDFRMRSMEQSIRNLSYDPAQALGLGEHGLLKEGWDANICVMDYERLHACADYAHPHRKNIGIHYVLVNGQIAVRNGVAIPGVSGGKVLKRCR